MSLGRHCYLSGERIHSAAARNLMTVARRKSAMDQSISRCIAATDAYRRHADSTRQRQLAAADLGLDEAIFREWEREARWMGWLKPDE